MLVLRDADATSTVQGVGICFDQLQICAGDHCQSLVPWLRLLVQSAFEWLELPDAERPCVIGRQPFGRIHVANSDADGHAYTNIAIDQGYRAVTEIMRESPAAQSAKASS